MRLNASLAIVPICLLGLMLVAMAPAESDPANHIRLGRTMAAKGDLEGAVIEYNLALEIDPKNIVVYNSRGVVREEKGDHEGAIEDCNRAIEIDPTFAAAYATRAYSKQGKGDNDGAIADATRAIELDARNGKAYVVRAAVGELKGDLTESIADYDHAILINPELPSGHMLRAIAKQSGGDYQGAKTDYEAAITLDPNFADAYRCRGIINQLLGRWDAASSDYGRFCELTRDGQDYPQFFWWVARARLGQTEDANKTLAAYLDKRLETAQDGWTLPVGGFLLGRVSEAGLLTATASPDPKRESGQSCEAWYYVGIKKLLAGDRTAAAADFRKCLATGRKTFIEYQFAEAELRVFSL